jgi:hypothetical protein
MACCLEMIQKPVKDPDRFQKVWEDQVYALEGVYEMDQ